MKIIINILNIVVTKADNKYNININIKLALLRAPISQTWSHASNALKGGSRDHAPFLEIYCTPTDDGDVGGGDDDGGDVRGGDDDGGDGGDGACNAGDEEKLD